jgi:succinyldiaminopimelate transaminase
MASQRFGQVIDCSVGTPVDPPPEAAIEALARADGARSYPSSFGSPALRDACSGWLERRFRVSLSPDSLAACVGTKEFVATLPGYWRLRHPTRDTVLFPEISYPTYAMGAELAGLRSVPVPVVAGRLELDAITPSDIDRALLLWTNSPSNPTGQLDELGAACEWGREHAVLVASDECYCEFTWTAAPATILTHGPSGVVAVHSLSKRSNLAGVRAGFYAGDPEVVAFLRAVRQHAGFMVPAPVQAAAAVAYGDDEHVDVQRGRYHRRLSKMSDALRSIGVEAPMPDGTFYLWVRRSGVDGWELARELAERAGLLVSPGEFYGVGASEHVRIAMVQPDDAISLVSERLTSP